MKMMLLEMVGIASAVTILGYMYMKKHPEKVQEMKDNMKEMSLMLYNKLDTED